jgi:hypothetical protein
VKAEVLGTTLAVDTTAHHTTNTTRALAQAHVPKWLSGCVFQHVKHLPAALTHAHNNYLACASEPDQPMLASICVVCRFAQRVGMIKNDASINEEVDPHQVNTQPTHHISRYKIESRSQDTEGEAGVPPSGCMVAQSLPQPPSADCSMLI